MVVLAMLISAVVIKRIQTNQNFSFPNRSFKVLDTPLQTVIHPKGWCETSNFKQEIWQYNIPFNC